MRTCSAAHGRWAHLQWPAAHAAAHAAATLLPTLLPPRCCPRYRMAACRPRRACQRCLQGQGPTPAGRARVRRRWRHLQCTPQHPPEEARTPAIGLGPCWLTCPAGSTPAALQHQDWPGRELSETAAPPPQGCRLRRPTRGWRAAGGRSAAGGRRTRGRGGPRQQGALGGAQASHAAGSAGVRVDFAGRRGAVVHHASAHQAPAAQVHHRRHQGQRGGRLDGRGQRADCGTGVADVAVRRVGARRWASGAAAGKGAAGSMERQHVRPANQPPARGGAAQRSSTHCAGPGPRPPPRPPPSR